ncbi:MAG: hypothetical protein UX62_C0037G0003 [Microgenomates group bacterium GW2011_GWA2_46_7]|nr:MAG: hypothetical protein UX62_C0037G0003 [Microgenomates group bacterium GW2011_GWA2_46_7]
MAGRSDIMVQRAVYQIAVMTMIAALTWLGVGIYQAYLKPTDVEVDKTILEPISPNIDQGVVQRIMERGSINEDGAR